MVLPRYNKNKFVETGELTSDTYIDVNALVARSIGFNIKRVMQAHDLYSRVCKIFKERAYPAFEIGTEIKKSDISKDQAWVNQIFAHITNIILESYEIPKKIKDKIYEVFDVHSIRNGFLEKLEKSNVRDINSFIVLFNNYFKI